MRRRTVTAFTLIELMVVLAVIGLLIGLALPAVQAARETARRMQCVSKLRQLGIAIANYEQAFRRIPGSVNGFSMHVSLLPACEQESLFGEFDFRRWPQDPVNRRLASRHVALYHCPSEVDDRVAATSYGSSRGTGYWEGGDDDGFYVSVNDSQSYLTSASITDGLSQTVAVSEVSSNSGSNIRYGNPAGSLEEIILNCLNAEQSTSSRVGVPWTEGSLSCASYSHTMAPNTCSCTNDTNIRTGLFSASSWHVNGLNTLFADGHVEFISDGVSRVIWLAYGSRNGNEPLGE